MGIKKSALNQQLKENTPLWAKGVQTKLTIKNEIIEQLMKEEKRII